VALVTFATAARYYGFSAADGRGRRRIVMSFPTPFRNAGDPAWQNRGRDRSVLEFLLGIIDPADSLGWWCFA